MKIFVYLFLFAAGTSAQAESLSGEARDAVMAAVNQRCAVEGFRSVTITKVTTRAERVDQDYDFFHSVTLVAVDNDGDGDQRKSSRFLIQMELAEYAIANPSVEKFQVLALASPICQ